MTHREGFSELAVQLQEQRQEALHHGLDLVGQAWRSFDQPRPAQPPISEHTQQIADAPLPRAGVGVPAALDVAAHILDESLAHARPRYFGYIGSSGLESAVLADALATSHDTNLAAESAAAYLVEQQALRWMAEFVGYPLDGGTFSSGGMASNLTALMAARTRAFPSSRVDGLSATAPVVYASSDAHSSIERAVEVLGLGRGNLRRVPIDAHRRMDPDALRDLVRLDLAAGLVPVAVVATAGTTITGAVDPLDAIADVCAELGVWMHVDGAYGLPAAGSAAAGALFAGLARADSASVDAHKWMFVPKACSVLMVRDQESLTRAFRHDASYMVEEEGFRHPVDGTLEYSRPFRSLKLWTALRAHGADAFRDAIERNLLLARHLHGLAVEHPRFEPLLPSPDLSIVPIRRLPASGDVDAHNMRLARALQVDGRVYVTSAVIDGVACLRPCIVNYRTRTEDVESILAVADEVGEALEAE
ncbi:MAG: aminotransferase class V-fold PLP-dependent enzyme [Candidatus Nanopelagicales bacterium]